MENHEARNNEQAYRTISGSTWGVARFIRSLSRCVRKGEKTNPNPEAGESRSTPSLLCPPPVQPRQRQDRQADRQTRQVSGILPARSDLCGSYSRPMAGFSGQHTHTFTHTDRKKPFLALRETLPTCVCMLTCLHILPETDAPMSNFSPGFPSFPSETFCLLESSRCGENNRHSS